MTDEYNDTTYKNFALCFELNDKGGEGGKSLDKTKQKTAAFTSLFRMISHICRSTQTFPFIIKRETVLVTVARSNTRSF